MTIYFWLYLIGSIWVATLSSETEYIQFPTQQLLQNTLRRIAVSHISSCSRSDLAARQQPACLSLSSDPDGTLSAGAARLSRDERRRKISRFRKRRPSIPLPTPPRADESSSRTSHSGLGGNAVCPPTGRPVRRRPPQST